MSGMDYQMTRIEQGLMAHGLVITSAVCGPTTVAYTAIDEATIVHATLSTTPDGYATKVTIHGPGRTIERNSVDDMTADIELCWLYGGTTQEAYHRRALRVVRRQLERLAGVAACTDATWADVHRLARIIGNLERACE